jgi:hypothetical protein
MSRYTQRVLSILILSGLIVAVCFHGHVTLGRMAQLSGYLSLFLALTLIFNHYRSRKTSRYRKKRGKQVPQPADHVEQAIRIMTLQDDGQRHYEKLPPEARKKSIFGGKMID